MRQTDVTLTFRNFGGAHRNVVITWTYTNARRALFAIVLTLALVLLVLRATRLRNSLKLILATLKGVF